MSNILLRAITGFFFILIIIGSLIGGNTSTMIVMSLFAILGLNEFYNLFKNHPTVELDKPIAFILSAIIFLISVCIVNESIDQKYAILIIPTIFLLFIPELYLKRTNPILNISIVILGLIYVLLPFILVIDLNHFSTSKNPLVVGMFLLIWTNDTFAYLSGRFFGKTKLFERISPKKTWEGTVGGILFTLLVAYFISFWSNDLPLSFWLIAALIIAPCSIFGDLIESLFKRSLNIKDSGNILPGHGGILDRFDAAIFSIPFFYALVIFYS